jgi:hypothetical protein
MMTKVNYLGLKVSNATKVSQETTLMQLQWRTHWPPPSLWETQAEDPS